MSRRDQLPRSRPDRSTSVGSGSTRPKPKDPPKRDERPGKYAKRGPKRDERGPKRDERGPKRDVRGAAGDSRGPKRDQRGPRRDERGAAERNPDQRQKPGRGDPDGFADDRPKQRVAGAFGKDKRSSSPRRDGRKPPYDDGKKKDFKTRREHKAPDPAMAKGAIWIPGPNARLINVEAGMDLGHFLVSATKDKLSVRAARRHLANGCCRIDGQVETYGSRILKRGEVVEFFLPEDREHVFEKKRVLLDDVGVIAYDKPAYLPVTPTDAIKSWSLLDILTPALGELFPVHRLDADTSGIVLFARSKEVAARLETFFKEHAVEKTYHAIVRGHPREQGEYRSYLVKAKSQPGFEKWKSGRGPDAREAITTWEVEQRLGTYASLVRIEPKTGRHHQIRIHFSEMDFPLYGDRHYGDRRDAIHVTRHLLHASRIRLPHPIGGPAIDVQSRLPKDFKLAMEMLVKV